jgi:hypothetical protein
MKSFGSRAMFLAAVLGLGLAGCSKDDPKPAPSPGRDNTPNGLGVVCSKDPDCENGLTCQLDSADPTNYQICTAPCTAETDCLSRFAEYTTCTGVHLCVVTCESNEECVDGTICDSHGWCQRGGPDSGVQACEGTVAACSTVSTQSACEAARCDWGGTCSGTPTACSTQTTEETCAARSGCEWFTSTASCSGFPADCSQYKSTETCTPQSGCNWVRSCVGSSAIATCEAAGLTFCATTPGCRLVTQ